MSSHYYNNTDNNTNYNHNSYDNQASSNDYYSQHPQQHQAAYHNYTETVSAPTPHIPENGEKGLLGALGGGIGGGILGKQTNHGFLGSVGGALVGSITEDFIKKRSRPSSPQPPYTGGTAATATATASAGAYSGHTPLASPQSPPMWHHAATAPAYSHPNGSTGTSTSTTTVATSYFQQPPCVGTAHPCTGQLHYCMPAHGNDQHHGNHGWGTWHK